MTKQKRGFWLFLFSLIPGAGEMYMGFRKQGISIMLLFWGVIAVAAGTGFGWILMFLPILWFYSFFNVHNLKSLSEEEFYSIEDTYVLHLDQLIGDADILISKHRSIAAGLLIFFGVSILWNNFTDFVRWFLPNPFAEMISHISYRLPQLIIAVAIIAAGCYILAHKKDQLEDDYKNAESEEHYWEPYRPYQQSGPTRTEQEYKAENTSAPFSGRPFSKPEMTPDSINSQKDFDTQQIFEPYKASKPQQTFEAHKTSTSQQTLEAHKASTSQQTFESHNPDEASPSTDSIAETTPDTSIQE